jgi:hypothetical protein
MRAFSLPLQVRSRIVLLLCLGIGACAELRSTPPPPPPASTRSDNGGENGGALGSDAASGQGTAGLGGNGSGGEGGNGAAVGGNGNGGNACAVGSTRCSATGPAVEICTLSGEWRMDKSCPSICESGACAGMCMPDEKQCGAGQTPAVCSKDGQWLSDSMPCDFVCTGKGECTGACKPGAKKCGDAPDTLIPFECDDKGAWVMRPACTNICVDGSCGGSCMPGKIRCVGNKPETCSDMGTWTPGQECKDQTCVDGACAGSCAPNAKQCNGNTPQTCDSQGNWKDAAACGNKACVKGVCVGLCQPGAVQCGPNNTPQTCDGSGVWKDGAKCSMQTCVKGACVGSCEPNAKQCNDNTPQTCDNQGNWKDGPACQAQTCVKGMCVGACAPGSAPRCSQDGKFIQTCGANGALVNGESCGDRGCAGAMCNVCKPNLKTCSGTALKQCSSDGKSFLPDVQCKVRCDGAALRCIDCEKKTETCNGLDDDCDGTADNNVPAKNCANACLGQQKCVVGGAGRFDPLQCPIGKTDECCGASGTNCAASGKECTSAGTCQIKCPPGKVPNGNNCDCPADAIECNGTCVKVTTKKFCLHANYPPGGGGEEQNPQNYCWLKSQQSECGSPVNFCNKFSFNGNLGMVIHVLNNVKQVSKPTYQWFCCATCQHNSSGPDSACAAARAAGQMCTAGGNGY